jgi:hypothetical protein
MKITKITDNFVGLVHKIGIFKFIFIISVFTFFVFFTLNQVFTTGGVKSKNDSNSTKRLVEIKNNIQKLDQEILKNKLDIKSKQLGISPYHRDSNVSSYDLIILNENEVFTVTSSKKRVTLRKGTRLIRVTMSAGNVFYIFRKSIILKKMEVQK